MTPPDLAPDAPIPIENPYVRAVMALLVPPLFAPGRPARASAPPDPFQNGDTMSGGPLQSPSVSPGYASLTRSYAQRGEPNPFATADGFGNDDAVLSRSIPATQPSAPYAPMKYADDDISNELPQGQLWNAGPVHGQVDNARLAQNFINNNPISEVERQKRIDDYADSARQFGKKTADIGTLLMLGGGIVGGATAQPEVTHGSHLLGGVLENLGGLIQNPWLDRQYGRGRTSQFEYERSRAIDEYNRDMFFGTGGARAP